MQQYAIISAWLLFIIGILNVILGLIMPSIRETRSVFASMKGSRNVLPTASTKSKKAKVHVSYPAPIDIGFPAPAALPKTSLAFGGAFDTHAPYVAPHRPSVSETVERRAVSPTIAQHGIHRSRSGKGVVTIRMDPNEELPFHKPPSYIHGQPI